MLQKIALIRPGASALGRVAHAVAHRRARQRSSAPAARRRNARVPRASRPTPRSAGSSPCRRRATAGREVDPGLARAEREAITLANRSQAARASSAQDQAPRALGSMAGSCGAPLARAIVPRNGLVQAAGLGLQQRDIAAARGCALCCQTTAVPSHRVVAPIRAQRPRSRQQGRGRERTWLRARTRDRSTVAAMLRRLSREAEAARSYAPSAAPGIPSGTARTPAPRPRDRRGDVVVGVRGRDEAGLERRRREVDARRRAWRGRSG